LDKANVSCVLQKSWKDFQGQVLSGGRRSPVNTGRRACPDRPLLEILVMAHLDPADLDKMAKLLETAMKTDVKKAKQREELRKKALSQLQQFKHNYAASYKSSRAAEKKIAEDVEKAVGIAEHELQKGHPLVAHLNEAIGKLKAIPLNTDYAQLDKAMDAVEDWDVAVEKNDLPKNAIKYLNGAKADYTSELSAIDKAVDEYAKLMSAAKKDLETVDDLDVKKELKELLDKHMK
jgi:hypothetical protein